MTREPSEPFVVPIDGVLDLHAFAPADTASVVNEYLRAARLAGLREVRVVHGRGWGVRRGHVQQILDRHPDVESFADDHNAHLGATFVRLKPPL